MTKQRVAILRCLSETGRPLSVEEVLTYAAAEIPHLNLSTVYRTLKKLVEEGKVMPAKLAGEKNCYEIVQKQHHHYFSCNGCNKTYFINRCPKGLLDIVPKGFQLVDHTITLNGFCLECIDSFSGDLSMTV